MLHTSCRALALCAGLAAGFSPARLAALRGAPAPAAQYSTSVPVPPMPIAIQFAPLAPRRRAMTREIAAAIRALAARPRDEAGQPGSFVVPAKHRSAVRSASADTGIAVRTRLEESTDAEGVVCRVFLGSAPARPDLTAPLPFADA